MTSVQQAFYDALLSDLAYVDGLSAGMTGVDLAEAIEGRIPSALAAAVGERFGVLAAIDDSDSSYQAAIFVDKYEGVVYVAHRGTTPLQDILDADVDLAVISGVARRQVAAMVNWWQDIALPAGQAYTRVALGGGASPLTFVPGDVAAADGTLRDVVLTASNAGKLRSVGHSLGGHLATILASLFGSQVSHTATFNGAGLYSGAAVSQLFLDFLSRGPLDQAAAIVGQGLSIPTTDEMDNFHAANGRSLTTNAVTFAQPGLRIPVYNEESFSPENHFIYKLTDSLALSRAFERLAPTVDLTDVTRMAEASASIEAASLEALLDGLRTTVLGPHQTPTPPFDDDGVGPERTAFHANIEQLMVDPAFLSLTDNVVIADAEEVTASAAMTDFGRFVTLSELLPFSLTASGAEGSDAALSGNWAANWSSAYDAWQADLEARDHGTRDDLNFTTAWYEDRRQFLSAVSATNRGDSPFVLGRRSGPFFVYEDRRLGIAITPVPHGVPPTSLAKMTFGIDGADTMEGDVYGDRLYGMNGNDTVSGGLGSDYIEGGGGEDSVDGGDDEDRIVGGSGDDLLHGGDDADILSGGSGADEINGDGGRDNIEGGRDADILRGGDGQDRLLGGDGADLLTGGAENDELAGGDAYDSYILAPNEGTDTIDDSDGQGELRVGADRITGGDPDGFGMWRSTFRNEPIRFAFNPGVDDRGDLVIDSIVGKTIVRNFKNGDLSITLSGKPDDLPDSPVASSAVSGTALDDNRSSTGGRKPVTGTASNDRVRALAGRDEASAGSGDDIVEGGTGVDLLAGESGKDAVFADAELTEPQLRDLISASATAPTEGVAPARYLVSTSEWLRGGLDDDAVVGTGGNDIVFGGGGKDLLVGGTGHDVINGDDDYDPFDLTTVYVEPGTGSGGPFDAWYSNVYVVDSAEVVGAGDEIHAGSGDDAVYAEVGDDLVWGDDGNDTISGGDSADTLFGNAGDDRITGDDYGLIVGDNVQTPIGDDHVDGGAGDDNLYGDGGNDILIGGEGNDVIRGNNDVVDAGTSPTAADDGDDWIAGDDGDDILVGDSAADTLTGDAGDDHLFGDSDATPVAFQGDDDLDGGDGDDYLRGYGGDDTLDGGEGDDVIHGEEGGDTVFGASGNDGIDAGAGNDAVSAGAGADSVDGGDGDDFVLGDEDDDLLAGGAGADQLLAGDGDDAAWGQDGQDTIEGNAGDDILSGGDDDDVLTGDAGNDSLLGDAGNDQLDGGDGDDALSGGVGDDSLLAGTGTDFLRGDAGDDTLVAGLGTGILQGGAGNDRYVVPAYAGMVYISDREGQDIVELEDEVKLEEVDFWIGQDETGGVSHLVVTQGERALAVIENGFGGINAPSIKLSDGHVVTEWEMLAKLATHSALNVNQLAIPLTPPTGNATYVTGQYDQKRVWAGNPQGYVPVTLPQVSTIGGDATDVIEGMGGALAADGGGGNDTVTGAYAADDLRGGDGDDTLTGNAGNDTLSGGAGSDALAGGAGNDRLDAGDGNDTLRGGDDDDVLVAGAGNDNAFGEAGRDRLAGDEGDDLLDGGAGSDILEGGNGDDQLAGADGNDTLHGGDDNDTLDAGEGNDLLDGAGGNDLLAGGLGDDVYLIDGLGQDRIRDSGGTSTLHFAAGLSESSFTMARGAIGSADEFSYILTFGGGRQLVVEDAVRTGGTRIEFADGRVLSMADLLSTRFPSAVSLTADALHRRLAGGGGNDTLTGASQTAELEGGSGNDSLTGAASRDHLLGGAGADILAGNAEADWLEGGAGNDTLRGDAGADRLFGDADADMLEGGDDIDVLLGGAGNDTLAGGLGNDLLDGGAGDDIYRMAPGSGKDRLRDGEGIDVVEFAAGITAGSVTFQLSTSSRGTQDLVARLGDGSELWIENAAGANVVSQFRFADGATTSLAQARALATTSIAQPNEMTPLIVGTGGADTIDGSGVKTIAIGLDGDDIIDGAYDVDGGVGNDTLTDGHVYRFGRGDGVDTIEHSNRNSTIYFYDRVIDFKPGIVQNDLSFARKNDDLVIGIKGTSDQLTVKGHFVDYGATMLQEQRPHAIAGLRFADGSSQGYEWIRNLFRTSTSGDDYLVNVDYGGEGNDVMRRESSWGDMYGGDGDDWMASAPDVEEDNTRLWGEGGNDTLVAQGGRGSEIGLYGGPGDDNLHGSGYSRLSGGPGNDRYHVQPGSIIVVDRDDGHDLVMADSFALGSGQPAPFTLRMSTGVYEDLRPLREGDDLRITLRDRDSSLFIPDFFTPGSNFGGLTGLTVSRRIDLDGFSLDQPYEVSPATLAARAVAVPIAPVVRDGTDAADWMLGSRMDDVLRGGAGNDEIDGLSGNDSIDGGEGNDHLVGRAGNDRIDAGAGENQIYPGFGDDMVVAGGGDDIIADPGGTNTIDAGAGNDIVRTYSGVSTIVGGAGDDELDLRGGGAVSGGGGKDSLSVMGAEAAALHGGDGDDELGVNGSGVYALDGGTGNDSIYISDASKATIAFGVDSGYDQIGIGMNATANAREVEIAFEAGIAPSDVTLYRVYNDPNRDGLVVRFGDESIGIDARYALTRTASAITAMRFADGTVWTGDDIVAKVRQGSEGDDLIVGGPGDDVLAGGGGSDTLRGEAGNDLLDGGEGGDLMYGGAGNDVYVVDTTEDGTWEVEFGRDTGGDDEVRASTSTSLWTDIERLTLMGSADLAGYGNELDNVISGNDGANFLHGAGGADRLAGGLGDDTYDIHDALDTIVELPGEGTDTFYVHDTATLPANIENLTMAYEGEIDGVGNELDNVLTGNDQRNVLSGMDGNDILLGNAGGDVLAGGQGNDTYRVADGAATIVEREGEGVDLVEAYFDFALGEGVENLTMVGGTTGTGNAVANTITGNAGWNTLDGRDGADTMIGLTGNDAYVVDNAGDVVVEVAAAGTDLVRTSIDYVLPVNVENLTLTGSTATRATGNAVANVLTGNALANVLDGLAGNDTMKGGAGDDTYAVDATGDVATENANEGIDTVRASVTLTLGANVENLVLTGTSAINGTGNGLANALTGNAANNVLNGGAGADIMGGGAGNDTYVVDHAADLVQEAAGEGTDLVQTSLAHVLGVNVENLTLTGTASINGTGNDLANVIVGNGGNNTLDGKLGGDTLKGGAGNDTYVVDATGDIVTESASQGTDTVLAGVGTTLAASVENLTLTGSAAINGTGNSQNNVLLGNVAGNVLNGGAGSDTMKGGAGDDTYVVDNAGDTITESAGAGTDMVSTAIAYVLPANVEHLTLTGTLAINGTGNTLANWLRGNGGVNALAAGDGHDTVFAAAGNDLLDGGAGNDLLQGGTGNDALTDTVGNNLLDGGAGTDALTGGAGREFFAGGTGADTLTTGGGADVVAFNKGDGADVVNASTGTDDTLSLGGALAYSNLKLRKSGLDLVLDAGAGDQITFQNWYQTGVNNKSILNLQVVADAMTAFNPAGADPLLNRKVVRFNFGNLVSQFDAALAANPSLTAWNMSNGLASAWLAGSDTAAVGGDFAYDFGHRNAFTDIGAVPAQSTLAAATFASAAQALQAPAALYAGTVRMS